MLAGIQRAFLNDCKDFLDVVISNFFLFLEGYTKQLLSLPHGGGRGWWKCCSRNRSPTPVQLSSSDVATMQLLGEGTHVPIPCEGPTDRMQNTLHRHSCTTTRKLNGNGP